MADALREHDVPVDPTLVVYNSMAHADRPEYRDNPALASVPEVLHENWRSFFNFNLGWTPSDFETARGLYPAAAAFVRFLHDSGVTLTVGSDANNPWIVPGDSYHRELELLAGNPVLDIRATRDIVWVMQGGVRLEPGSGRTRAHDVSCAEHSFAPGPDGVYRLTRLDSTD